MVRAEEMSVLAPRFKGTNRFSASIKFTFFLHSYLIMIKAYSNNSDVYTADYVIACTIAKQPRLLSIYWIRYVNAVENITAAHDAR